MVLIFIIVVKGGVMADNRRVFYISSRDRLDVSCGCKVGGPFVTQDVDDFSLNVPNSMLPGVNNHQYLRINVLKVVIPIQQSSIDTIKTAGLHMCQIHTDIPTNNFTSSGLSTVLLVLPFVTSLKENAVNAIVFDSQREQYGVANVWHKDFHSIRFWLTDEFGHKRPDLFNMEWFITIAIEAVESDPSKQQESLLTSIDDNLRVMLLSLDNVSARLFREEEENMDRMT